MVSLPVSLPNDLRETTQQAIKATQAAIAEGQNRLQVELRFPELKIQPIAQQFIQEGFGELGHQLRIFFPDAGAAALARRDWGETDYAIRGINDVRAEIQAEESTFIFVEPSSVEVVAVEKLCEQAGDRPVIFLNPQMEDIATIGIGYAGRQLRERFLNRIETCYHLRPMENAALFRCYPEPWQLWLETDGTYEKLAAFDQRPSSEMIDNALLGSSSGEPSDSAANRANRPPKAGFLTELQRIFNALSR